MGKGVTGAAVGRFCQTSTNRLGIGRLIAVAGETASIRYTDLPVPNYQHTVTAPVESVTVGELPVETRAFVPMNGYWTAGRVQGRFREKYRILLPNGLVADLDETEFEVRWSKPMEDPAAGLAEFVTGSVAFHQARYPFRVGLQRERAVFRGYGALASSAIGLYEHQINAATKVLVDPVMRYLLADEVGLGKTIQAGIVIRQVLLDDPKCRVVVGVPDSLVLQWERELNEKFFVNAVRPIGRSRVTVAPFASISEAVDENEPQLLVVDEAHRLCGAAEAPFEDLLAAAARVQGLLLLTATPYRGKPETFLRMLHLLDSVAFPLDDVEAFEKRIEERQQDAYAVLSLDALMPEEVLQPLIHDVVERHGYDAVVRELAAKSATEAFGSEAHGRAIEGLRSYLREANRISRRVIRNRRESRAAVGFPVRGRKKRLVPVSLSATKPVERFIEELRDLYVEGSNLPPFDTVVEGCLAGGPHLTTTLDQLIAAAVDNLPARSLAMEIQAEIALLEDADMAWSVGPIRDALRSIGSKGLVACSSTANAELVARVLAHSLGSRAVVQHRDDMSLAERNASIESFVTRGDVQILVIDESGEEGRNLQVADFILHVDLPISPNRLEQRVGRVDRFGFGKPVVNLIPIDDGSQYQRLLVALMADGIGLFDHSVATLQLPLARLETSIRVDLAVEGASAFEFDQFEMRNELDEQRQRIDELEEIESSEAEAEFSPEVIREMMDYEEQWGEIESAFDAFTASGDGGVQLSKVREVTNQNIFEYSVDARLRTIPLMRMDHLNRLARLLPGRRSFSRMISLRNPGVRPVRFGDPMVDWLEEYLALDDRGKVWGIWRTVPGLADGVMLAFFRFDFVVSFDEDHLLQVLQEEVATRRVRRRGDAFFPPRSMSVWVHDGRPVPQNVIAEVLDGRSAASNARRADFSLSWKNLSLVAGKFPDWANQVFEARSVALSLVESNEELTSQAAAAEEGARHEFAARLSTLKSGSLRPGHAGVMNHLHDELELHQQITDALMLGIRSPAVTLFAAGCVLVTSSVPTEE